ncbi:S-layer homology domain-containing protein [Aneurinibacillus aneurinilyticus]|uniref:S-layer homology domain-containing protein n=1 Tax=Aneurinibacillus aneurinilyticus TaxID=1391 RepID=A0A848D3D6_ANEAE|nr:S-layer homology domain-containing protein [Aneurinibacillus aneurinilyticus]NMF00527.1 S-layer homology domain-containing protein [Aneurinibacillus aneurinilyticus]
MKVKKSYNKVLSTAVILSMVLGPTSALADTSAFKDLNQAASWAQGGIMEAKNRDLMKGDNNGNFRPKALVTRQEVASILVNILKLEEPNVQVSSYTDVPPNAWGMRAIEAVKNAGIMRGDGNGKFRPNAPVTREELAVVLVSAIKADTIGKGGSLGVADAGKISSWARPAVQVAMEKGLLRGDGKNFNPKQNAPRQEVAIMAVNLANALQQTPAPAPTPAPTPSAETIEAKVESVTDSAITLSGKSYDLSSDVRDLLNDKNREALKNATIKVETKDKTITKVTYLELTASGQSARSGEKKFSDNVVLDGGTVNGDVKVKGDYVSLKNVRVKGDLEITRDVSRGFYSYKVIVDGKTKVNGGNSEAVTFESAELGKVEINKRDVRVEVTGSMKTDEITVLDNATLVADSDITLSRVTVKNDVSSIEVRAKITTLEIENRNTRLTLGDKARIDKLILASSANVGDVVKNYQDVKGRIDQVSYTSSSGSSRDRGSGSSSSSEVTYTKSEDSLGTIYKDVRISGSNITIKNGTIKGNVLITSGSKDVTLRNVRIEGSLTMTASNSTTLDYVTVTGQTILQ